MDVDVYKVSEIIEGNHRFISPFSEPCGYYIVEHGRHIDKEAIELYWEQLKYAEKNIDRLVEQGFHPSFYEFYGVNKRMVESSADMCRRLIIESFVLLLQDNTFTVGCCLSNSEFMFGHYIDCEWDCDWNLINSYIC